MNYKNGITFLFVYASLAFLGCNKIKTTPHPDAFARVGNTYLLLGEAREQIPDFILKEDSIGALKRFRDDWIKKQILLREANRLALDQKEEVIKKLNQAREEVLTEVLKAYIISTKNYSSSVSDEEARNYFQAHKDQFILDERYVKFRHLTTKTLKEARAAKQKLLDATPWPKVANTYAINPKTAISESQQFWPMSMALNNNKIMNRYLKVIGHNEISTIRRVNGEYHFVQLTASRAKGEQPDLEWLMKEIKNWMELNNKRREFSSYTKNLYLKAKSNNEVESFNVLSVEQNQKSTLEDTSQSKLSNE